MKTTKKEKISGYSILIFASFLALFPLFWTFSTSIKNRVDTYTLPPKFFDFTPTFKNYTSLFAIDAFPKIYLNTILYATTISILWYFFNETSMLVYLDYGLAIVWFFQDILWIFFRFVIG